MCLGMNDDGTFGGCASLNPKQVNRVEALQELCPDARCDTKRIGITQPNGNADFIILARVHYRNDRVVKTPKGKAFIRRADQKHKLTAERYESYR